VVHGSAVRDRGCWRVWVCIDDLVAALFSFADYRGYTTEDAFALEREGGGGGPILGVVAVEDFCLG
jgi:hypothetical protein